MLWMLRRSELSMTLGSQFFLYKKFKISRTWGKDLLGWRNIYANFLSGDEMRVLHNLLTCEKYRWNHSRKINLKTNSFDDWTYFNTRHMSRVLKQQPMVSVGVDMKRDIRGTRLYIELQSRQERELIQYCVKETEGTDRSTRNRIGRDRWSHIVIRRIATMIIIVLHAIGRRRKVTNRKDYYPPILFAKLERKARKFSLVTKERTRALLLLNHICVGRKFE